MLRRIFAGLLFMCAVALAQTTPSKVLVATGKQVQIALMSPGTWVCEGGQVTVTGPPFCSPGTKKVSFSYMSSKYSMQLERALGPQWCLMSPGLARSMKSAPVLPSR